MSNRRHLVTSESVTEGHPDKLCDQIADAILDEMLEKEPKESLEDLRCACEVTATTGIITVMGETRNESYVDIAQVARNVILDVGYDSSDVFFDGHTCAVANYLHSQSPDIALGVDKASEAKAGAEDKYDSQGAGDQGIIYGYACNETKTLMPMPIYLAHRLSEKLTEVRKNGKAAYLRPDGKTQVTVVYEDDKPVAVDTILISTQHAPEATQEWLEDNLLNYVIMPVMNEAGIDWNGAKLYINPTGNFVIGGPHGDTGLTGRKIVVDTYGGVGRVGGGAFSGKDPSKVDRSAAYAARYVAKNVVASGLAEKCEIQISYAIGVAHPLSIFVDTFGTATVDEKIIEQAIKDVFDLRPAAIIHDLDLRRPIYRKTSNYGHFGRELDDFTWEKTDKIDELKERIEKLIQPVD